ncbi:hypothetical protein Ahy_A09g044738 [Arachis hypogaea]|uniref:ATPase F1/V1/A1 complex alpha/beta subunit N-terminal domain-containing protein n=1 Tax=Arachis hypogaea TaxID=3818 RepID=A0A445BKN5_ARAHY|nr:hypothetical protein Ahy_A09g044738 [Arachis hypogaea]
MINQVRQRIFQQALQGTLGTLNSCLNSELYLRTISIVNIGTVLQVSDGIARIYGLDEVIAGELVKFEKGTKGIALNLESNNVGVVLMGDGLIIQERSSVKAIERIAHIPVIEAYLGRVINEGLNQLVVEEKFHLSNLD